MFFISTGEINASDDFFHGTAKPSLFTGFLSQFN